MPTFASKVVKTLIYEGDSEYNNAWKNENQWQEPKCSERWENWEVARGENLVRRIFWLISCLSGVMICRINWDVLSSQDLLPQVMDTFMAPVNLHQSQTNHIAKVKFLSMDNPCCPSFKFHLIVLLSPITFYSIWTTPSCPTWLQQHLIILMMFLFSIHIYLRENPPNLLLPACKL